MTKRTLNTRGKRLHEILWSDHEKTIMRRNYARMPNRVLAARFGRSKQAVWACARRLNLRKEGPRQYHEWTPEQILRALSRDDHQTVGAEIGLASRYVRAFRSNTAARRARLGTANIRGYFARKGVPLDHPDVVRWLAVDP